MPYIKQKNGYKTVCERKNGSVILRYLKESYPVRFLAFYKLVWQGSLE